MMCGFSFLKKKSQQLKREKSFLNFYAIFGLFLLHTIRVFDCKIKSVLVDLHHFLFAQTLIWRIFTTKTEFF